MIYCRHSNYLFLGVERTSSALLWSTGMTVTGCASATDEITPSRRQKLGFSDRFGKQHFKKITNFLHSTNQHTSVLKPFDGVFD